VVKKTLLLFALTHQFLQRLIEGDELYTRVYKKVATDESQGWTVVLMDRATRFIWGMHCGRQDRKRFQKAMRLLCQVIKHTGDLTLLTDGEKRDGSLLFELCSQALRTGKQRLDVYWIMHNFVRVHFTTRQVPAVALGMLEESFSLQEIFWIQKVA